MADLDRTQRRLDNIRTVEPILGALRTISLGTWQTALRQTRGLRQYAEQLQGMLPLLAPYLVEKRAGFLKRWYSTATTQRAPAKVAVLVVGTERGLCGRFNQVVAAEAEMYLAGRPADGVEVLTLGSRVERLLAPQHDIVWAEPLPATALPDFSLVFRLTRAWLRRYEAAELDAVDLIYNAYETVGRYTPTVARLIPPEAPPVRSEGGAELPLTIVETDPLALYARVVEQWAAIHLYSLLLNSAAAEHSTRYQLMEGAAQNADRLIEELTLTLQSIRRQAITREMQELAVGSGLLEGGQ